jgi:hypothetical protein
MEGCFDQPFPCPLGATLAPAFRPRCSCKSPPALRISRSSAAPKPPTLVGREAPWASPVYYFADDFWRLAKPSKVGLSGS